MNEPTPTQAQGQAQAQAGERTQPSATTTAVECHTPGPWAFGGESLDIYQVATGKTIARAPRHPYGANWSNDRANARLIAAAPETKAQLATASLQRDGALAFIAHWAEVVRGGDNVSDLQGWSQEFYRSAQEIICSNAERSAQ
jgi:hypothetical protein